MAIANRFVGVGALGKLSPDTVKGYVTLGGAGQKTGRLDAKTRELIALAVAISLRCDGCITVHTEAATRLTRRQTLKAPSRGDLPMTANVLRILGVIATPVSQRIGVLMHAAADNPYGQAAAAPAR